MSRPSSHSKFRRFARAAAALVGLVLFAAACSSDGFPESYSDQPITNDQGETVSLVQDNWMKGCTVGIDESNLADDANTVCQCSFNALSSADSGISFEAFVEMNNELKGDPSSLANAEALSGAESQLLDIVKNCIASAS